jgi:hypothetical protein
MDRIWPNGETTKEDLIRRLDRVERLLREHRDTGRALRRRCANHVADALGAIAKCLLDHADRALDAAEKAAMETEPESNRPLSFTLPDLERLVRAQRSSLPAGAGNPKDGWPQ